MRSLGVTDAARSERVTGKVIQLEDAKGRLSAREQRKRAERTSREEAQRAKSERERDYGLFGRRRKRRSGDYSHHVRCACLLACQRRRADGRAAMRRCLACTPCGSRTCQSCSVLGVQCRTMASLSRSSSRQSSSEHASLVRSCRPWLAPALLTTGHSCAGTEQGPRARRWHRDTRDARNVQSRDTRISGQG